MTVKGVLWHSTGANNPTVKRYVQPSDNDPNRDALLKIIGKNRYGNDWNHKSVQAGLNAWIGKMEDGSVRAVQSMPWNYRPWGCGSGTKGSCNDHWIQFEICEDALTDQNYFNLVYKEACELTAYLCKMYNLDPKGTVTYNGIKVPVLLCHADSAKLKLGSNHGDVYHWFKKYGKSMDTVRADVKKLIDDSQPVTPPSTTIKAGDLVSIRPGAQYYNGGAIPAWVIKKNWYVVETKGDRTVLGKSEDGANNINSPVHTSDLTVVKSQTEPSHPIESLEMYRVRITWEDSKSQKGAYRNLDSAKSLADQYAEEGYKVFNNAGQVVYTPEIKKPEEPTVKEGKPYEIVTEVNKYRTASDAKNQTNSVGTYAEGTYYIYDKYPDGVNGMLNISTDKTGSSAGGWVNPDENVKKETPVTPDPVKPDPVPEEPTVDVNVPVYENPTKIVGEFIVGTDDYKESTVKFFKKITSINPDFDREILDTFISQSSLYGIDPFIAVSQSILETGWFRFAGSSVSPEQHNYCGLGATGGGVSGASFETVLDGVNAQYQHLFAYGCTENLPEDVEIVDPRYSLVTRGKALHWEDLAGKWAVPGYDKNTYPNILEASLAGATYGQKFIKICKDILNTEITDEEVDNYFKKDEPEVPVDPDTPVVPDVPTPPVNPEPEDPEGTDDSTFGKIVKEFIRAIIEFIKSLLKKKD